MHDSKKFIFLVQGEGRGHMTQAMSLYHMLTAAGHFVQYVFIGKSDRRKIPEYFLKSFECPVEPVDSPNFIADKNNQSIRLIPSILHNIRFIGKYFQSMKKINQAIKKFEPDYVINFYEFIGGFYHMFFHPSSKHIVVGHQFLAAHPSFRFAPGHRVDRALFKMNNWLTSYRADKKLALSFSEYSPLKFKRVVVCPPLLRKDISQTIQSKGSFILGYMVNDGYYQQIVDWHDKNRDIEVHCFWDKKGESEIIVRHENLFFHQLNAEKYRDLMAECMGLVTTAGFESVCEAMYFGKPVLMIPVEGQYEQACNAIDAVSAGAGISWNEFNISELIKYLPGYQPVQEKFKEWVGKAESIILRELS